MHSPSLMTPARFVSHLCMQAARFASDRLTRQSSFILNLIVNDPDTGDRPRATYVRSTLGVRGRWQRSNEVLPCEAPSEALAFMHE